MIKIGITGSVASGKTTASKFLSSSKGPLFSADNIVNSLYKNNTFKTSIAKKMKVKNDKNLKNNIKKKLIENNKHFLKLEKVIHPIVRQEMQKFTFKFKKKKFLFYEIPLLVESSLMSFFDIIIFIKSEKKIRLKRFIKKGGNRFFFATLNKQQLTDKRKIKFCKHVVTNNKNLKVLKKKLLCILKLYE